jgi:hypothetical protein
VEIVYISRSEQLRIGSAVSRALDHVESVHVLMLEPDEKTRKIATAAGARVHQHNGAKDPPALARKLIEIGIVGRTLLIALDNDWKLTELPSIVTAARRGPDVHLFVKHLGNKHDDTIIDHTSPIDEFNYTEATIQFASVTKVGMCAIADQFEEDSPSDLPENIRVRVVELSIPSAVSQPTSLTSASGFMRLLYWMLESKHPLVLFGIPGALLFWVGYQMVGQLVDIGGPYDTIGIGVALAAFAATFVGVFSLTAALILYVLGKQVERIQAEFTRSLDS